MQPEMGSYRLQKGGGAAAEKEAAYCTAVAVAMRKATAAGRPDQLKPARVIAAVQPGDSHGSLQRRRNTLLQAWDRFE